MESRIEIILSNGNKAGDTLKELTKQANTLNKEIKDLKPGTEQFAAKAKDLQKVNGKMGEIKDQIKGTTNASNALKDAFNKFVPFSGTFGQVGQAITGTTGSVGGLTKSFGILKTAIIATGLGALVVLLGSLFAWFQKTERGGDLLAKVMSALGAAWNVLIDRGSKLIDALIAFASGDWTEAATKFKEATSDVADEIIRETKAAWDLADALDQLEELEGKLILQRSRTKEQVAELRLLAKDETIDIGKRSAAIQKAIQLTQQLNQKELEAAKGRIMQALQVTELSEQRLQELLDKGEELLTVDNLGLGESTQEDLNKAFEALAKYNELRATSFDEERALVMELNKLKKKDRAEDLKDEKALAAEKKKLKEQELQVVQNIEDLTIEAMLEGVEKEIALIELETQRKIEALIGSAEQITEQKALLLEIEEMRMAEVRDKYATAAAEKDKKAKEEQEKRDKEASDKAADLAEKTAQAKFNSEQAYLSAQSDFLQMAIDLLGQDEAARKKHATAIKVFTVGKILVDGIREVQAIWAGAGQLGPILGPIVGALQTGIAVARTGIAIKKANSQKFSLGGFIKKLALGGFLQGPSHSQGGIPIEAEGGEFIFSKKAVQAIGVKRLMRVNDHFTRKMAIGGPVSSFRANDRPPVASGSARPSASDGFGMERLESFLIENFQAINARFDRIKVINVATETDDVIKTINTIKDDADV